MAVAAAFVVSEPMKYFRETSKTLLFFVFMWFDKVPTKFVMVVAFFFVLLSSMIMAILKGPFEGVQ